MRLRSVCIRTISCASCLPLLLLAIVCRLSSRVSDGSPHLYQTDPTGNYSEWTANAIGRSSKTVTEYLEKHHETPDTCTEAAAIRLTVSALLEVVESGQKNIEIAVIRKGTGMELVNQDLLDTLSKEISEEKEKAKAASAERTENN
jgi:20S proteasome subunit alpha 4